MTLDSVAGSASLADVARELDGCRRCGLWRQATQAVPGRGPSGARIMLVGEQPGDAEDMAGMPFVGPAGRILDEALARAGLEREALFVTNAVKHFKHEIRGKRRLHRRPDAAEIAACRFWLDQERTAVSPKVIVALGATAATAILGHPVAVMASRGRVFDAAAGERVVVTVHPSYVLRLRDRPAKDVAMTRLAGDLAYAGKL